MAKTTVPSQYIADNAVTTAKIAANAITAEQIAGGAIVSVDLGDNSITIASIASNAVGSSEIAANAVGNSEIAANAVDSAEIVSGSIDTVHLSADAVDGTKIGDDSIDSEHYVDGSIDTAHIGDSQVTNAKLANSSVTVNSNSVALGASITLDTDDVGEGSTNLYYTDARAQSAISAGTGITVSSGEISIAGNAITATMISANAVGSSEIAANSVNSAEIAANAVSTSELASTAAPTFASITTTGDGDIGGNLTVTGNLQVDGTTTTINSTNLSIDDLNITLAAGAANAAAADGAGITVDGASATITYDGTNDEWKFNRSLKINGPTGGSNPQIEFLNTNGVIRGGKNIAGTGTDTLQLFNNGLGVAVEYGGFVGIGTSSPSKLLTIGSTTTANPTVRIVNSLTAGSDTAMYSFGLDDTTDFAGIKLDHTERVTKGLQVFTASGYGYPITFAASSTTPQMTLDTSGNLGIGATSAFDNKLEVDGGAVRVRGISNPSVKFNNGDVEVVAIRLNAGATGTLGLRGDSVLIDASGNVGIGTSSPEQKLHIAEANGGGIGPQLVLDNYAGSTLNSACEISFLTDGGASSTGTRNARITAINTNAGNGATALTFHTWSGSSDEERMRITSLGNVGIGINDPATKVHIVGGSNNTVSQANANLNVEGAGGNGLVIGTMVAPTYASYIQSGFVDNFATAVYPLLLNPSGGNVGIGTTPATRLHVNSGTTAQIMRLERDGSAVYDFTVTDGGDGAAQLYFQAVTNNTGYNFQSKNASGTSINALFINPDGNIGVGTTSPDVQLEVAGASGSSSTLKLSGRPDWTAGNGQYNVGNIFGENLGAGVNTTRIKLDGDDTSGTIQFYTANSGTLTSAMVIDNSQNVVFGSTTNYSRFDSVGNLLIEQGGAIRFESASNDYSTQYSAIGYTSRGYSTSQRYWHHLISKGGTHITINSDGGSTDSENPQDDFVIWQGTQDTAEPLFRVSNTGRVIAKQNYEIGNHKTNKEEFGVNAINTVDTATSDINTTITNTYENRPGVYWLNFNSKRFRAFIKPNWLQSRNWVLAAKFFSHMDMPSGSSLWTNDTSWNGGDFDLNNGHFSKYGNVWRYFGFDRLAMQMGDRVAPIMQFSSTQTLYGAFSGGRAANGGGVSPTSTDPALSVGATYHGMINYLGGTFTDLVGLEDKMQSYGLNKWANNSANSTSANNQGSRSLTAGGKGFELTVEDSHDNIGGNDSIGFAGAWIGCPLDEGNCNPLATASNFGADSGFGFGGGCGNNARTWTSGIAEWNRGNEVANYLPAYIWLSID